ncbi:MAG: amidohydrolase/deacetylase family metallohydrolase [Treponema sp.]|nr:amidohydrolase/deacetylase family metallohydrolase [Treponema sp.]
MTLNFVNPCTGNIEEVSLNCPKTLSETDLYISPPWIDFHCHVYHGVTSLSLKPDDIGIKTGVHLLVDAGSAGEETFPGFRDYVLPRYKTKVLTFLNISSIGLTSLQESHDMRRLDPQKTAACVKANPELIAGIKVRSSGLIVEDRGTLPLQRAVQAANLAECPIMIHFGENPPGNAENLSLMRKGDIVSHCFHGKESPLWDDSGNPIYELSEALSKGILLDVAHGAASLSIDIAEKAVRQKKNEFSISTDLHFRNIGGPVYSLSHTMSKFLSLGMTLIEVIKAVTKIPADRLGLSNWCSDPGKNATIFRIREKKLIDPPFIDSHNKHFNVNKVIEPIAIIIEGEWVFI